MNELTHKTFIENYKARQLIVKIDKNRAGDFVLSQFADKYNKPAHYFWTWLGLLLVVPTTIVFLFISWKYAVISFILGHLIVSSARKTDQGFVLENMLNNEDFFEYVLLHRGALITDNEGKELTSSFLGRMVSK